MKKILLSMLFINLAFAYPQNHMPMNHPDSNSSKLSVDMIDDKTSTSSMPQSKDDKEFKVANELYKKKEYIKAKELFQRLCDAKHGASCVNLGFLYDNGLGIKTDKEKALKYYEQGCDLNVSLGCKNLGLAYFKGDGVIEHDFKKASIWFERGCGLMDGFCCANLGYQYENGDGLEKNLELAKKFYTLGCKFFDAQACTNLGVLATNEEIPDITTARAMFKKGCDMGDELGCKYDKTINSAEFNATLKNHNTK